MKSDKKNFLAFCLNIIFSIVEFIGGYITCSISIISDAVHDLGDGISIGFSCFLEKLSHKKPDSKYTYGYYRYSVLGSLIQSVILLTGSVIVIYNAICRIIEPQVINYDGMIIIAIIGFIINFIATYLTSGKESLNQKSINLHMLEDVLGWAAVLFSAIIMKFTNWYLIDPILSIALAIFICFHAIKNLLVVINIFLEKTPSGIDVEKLKVHLLNIDGVKDIHHLHIWSMDGNNNSATLHVVADSDFVNLKQKIKEELLEHNISHSTIECEVVGEKCNEVVCNHNCDNHIHNHHHHHH